MSSRRAKACIYSEIGAPRPAPCRVGAPRPASMSSRRTTALRPDYVYQRGQVTVSRSPQWAWVTLSWNKFRMRCENRRRAMTL